MKSNEGSAPAIQSDFTQLAKNPYLTTRKTAKQETHLQTEFHGNQTPNQNESQTADFINQLNQGLNLLSQLESKE